MYRDSVKSDGVIKRKVAKKWSHGWKNVTHHWFKRCYYCRKSNGNQVTGCAVGWRLIHMQYYVLKNYEPYERWSMQ